MHKSLITPFRSRVLRKIALFLIIAASSCGAPTLGHAAETRSCSLAVAENVTVVAIGEGALLTLKDKRSLRLANILVPTTNSDVARTLSALIANQVVALSYDERATDRHRNLVAHLFVGAGKTWVQGSLIEKGLARVHSWPDTRRCVPPLLELERAARAARRGIWAQARYRVRRADELAQDVGTFQIFEGLVQKVSVGRQRAYLNFGENYRTDVTVTIAKRDLRRFTTGGIDPASWQGKPIRVRGWISLLNGPEIEVSHPEQIEMLEPAPARK